jgi:hypothetical protein
MNRMLQMFLKSLLFCVEGTPKQIKCNSIGVFISLHFASLHFTSLHCTALHTTPHHSTQQHATAGRHSDCRHADTAGGSLAANAGWVARCLGRVASASIRYRLLRVCKIIYIYIYIYIYAYMDLLGYIGNHIVFNNAMILGMSTSIALLKVACDHVTNNLSDISF